MKETHARQISEEAIAILLNYDYPGNIRELENILEHAFIICQDKIIERRHLPIFLQKGISNTPSVDEPVTDLNAAREHSERHRIYDILKKNNWNRGKAARQLNINRTTLWRKMKKYNLSP